MWHLTVLSDNRKTEEIKEKIRGRDQAVTKDDSEEQNAFEGWARYESNFLTRFISSRVVTNLSVYIYIYIYIYIYTSQ